jgi:hypothetical protein
VDQVRADEKLRLTVGQLADGVSVPNFLKKRFRHRKKEGRWTGTMFRLLRLPSFESSNIPEVLTPPELETPNPT